MKARGSLVVLVTGISSGIGRAIAETLAAEGHRVYGTVRSKTSQPAMEGIALVTMDVLDEASVQEAVRLISKEEGRIDVLVNNAGVAMVGAIEETTVPEARDLFDTNLFGMARVTRAVLPLMRAGRHGRVVNIGSVVGFLPAPFMGYYAASKHAVEGYTESLDHELRPLGIRAIVIEPGFVKTRIGANARRASQAIPEYAASRRRIDTGTEHQVQNGIDPSVVARAVLRALQDARPRNRYTVGRAAARLKRLRRFMPAGLFDKGLRRQFGLES